MKKMMTDEEQQAIRKQYYEEHKDEFIARVRKRQVKDVNSKGITKNHIRVRSKRLLFKTHAKLTGYQIHHCFGYDDWKKFIYIPRSLHLQIHRLLRSLKIPAASEHWNVIRDLVNSCDQYTYIRA